MGIAKYYKDNLQIKRATVVRTASGAATTTWKTVYIITATTISFTAGHTISDSANGFVTAGFTAGMLIDISDAGGFNRIKAVIESVTAGAITTTSGSTELVTKSAAASGSVTINNYLLGFINENAGGKQFQVGQSVVISQGRAFLPINTLTTGMTITEKDRIYNMDSGKTYEIIYDKRPNLTLAGKISFFALDVRNVSV